MRPTPPGRRWAGFSGASLTEPEERIAELDAARRHYVAFTRARRLLVLTCSGRPQKRFRSIWEGAPRWPDVDQAALARQRFGDRQDEFRQTVIEFGHLRRLAVKVGTGRGTAPRACWS